MNLDKNGETNESSQDEWFDPGEIKNASDF
jgi:hypothetical protein